MTPAALTHPGPFPDLSAAPRTGPSLPALPADPLTALLNGLHLPALPGTDQLLGPLRSLQSSFGSGALGALNPAFAFKESAGALDKVMSSTDAALQTIDYVWKGLAADDAKSSGKAAAASGSRLSDQGTSLGGITESAAQTVQRGSAKLADIARSFAHDAIALAPIYFTPPGQAALLTTAVDHLSQALATVSTTQAELAVQAAGMANAAAPIGIPAPPKLDPLVLADDVLHISQPLLEEATGLAGDLIEALSKPPAAPPGQPKA